jgi:hypothetical protein
MTREEKLETIVKLFAKIMFYGEWQWETPNERVITMLMQEVGMYPFKDEDEMISKTPVSEDLYQKANKEITFNTKREMRTAEEIVNEMMEQTDEMLVEIHKNISEKIGETSADEWVEMLKKFREREIERQTK